MAGKIHFLQKGQDADRIREECRLAYDSRWISGKIQGEAVMFTPKECRLLSAPYFRLIRQTDAFYEIQSKNTGHFWIIKKPQTAQQNPIIIYHKHTRETPYYHKHGKAWNVQSALQQIKSHDVYQMNGRQAASQ